MTRHKSTCLLALLLAVILCMSQASALNIIHEEDYEVIPDYSQLDVESAVPYCVRWEQICSLEIILQLMDNDEGGMNAQDFRVPVGETDLPDTGHDLAAVGKDDIPLQLTGWRCPTSPRLPLPR